MRRPRIGVIGRQDFTGLGTMTCEFVRHNADRISALGIVVRPEKSRAGEYLPWIDGPVYVWPDQPSTADLRDFLRGLDVLIGFETFYHPDALPMAVGAEVRTVLFPMWECSPANSVAADLLIATTDQDARQYPEARQLEWPVDPDHYGGPVRPFQPPRRILCSAGWGGLHDRNNLPACLRAAQAVTRSLPPDRAQFQFRALKAPVVPYLGGPKWLPPETDPARLYAGADVLLHLQGFPGLSLPLSEAAAVGLPAVVIDMPCFQHYPEHQRIQVEGWEVRPFGNLNVPIARPSHADLCRKLFALLDGQQEPKAIEPPPTWGRFNKQFWPLVEALAKDEI